MEQLSASVRLNLKERRTARGFLIMTRSRKGMGILSVAVLAMAICPWLALAGGVDKAPPVDDAIDYQAAAAEMEQLYTLIIQRFKGDAVFVTKLRAAQLAWRRFRDAQLEALYPAADKQLAYGSAYSGCRQMAMAVLTRQRIEQLRLWLIGVAEGDVCAGSLPTH
jgi:uncharacterized protein YecT (DUF1311 family)